MTETNFNLNGIESLTLEELQQRKDELIKNSKGGLKDAETLAPYQQLDILEKLKNPNLLDYVKQELDKDHKEDDNLKLTNFIAAVSGLSKNHRKRISMAITGDSAVGKDNLFKTIAKHMPTGTTIFLTNATQATLEDDVKDKRIIIYSELNKDREEGANKHLVEAIKQMAEGGMSALKKDIRNALKTSRFEEDEQKSVMYGTTEENRDEELETRFVCGGMKYTYARGKIVNEDTLDTISDVNRLLDSSSKDNSWIKNALNYLYFNRKKIDEVIIPYADELKEIDEEPVFNYDDPRSQRDIKRLFALTAAHAWIFQLQRFIFEYKGKIFLVSEPIDFLNVLKRSEEFFNETYTGLDIRIAEILEVMKKYIFETLISDDNEKWVPRDFIEKETGKSKNTIKRRMDILAGEGFVEGTTGKELNLKYEKNVYDSNKIYYRRCQKGVKKVLIRCQFSKIESKLKQFSAKKLIPFGYPIDTLDFTNQLSFNKISSNLPPKPKVSKNAKDILNPPLNLQIDTLELTPLETPKQFYCSNCGSFLSCYFKDKDNHYYCDSCVEEKKNGGSNE